jgi:hypothetical protein
MAALVRGGSLTGSTNADNETLGVIAEGFLFDELYFAFIRLA